MDKSIPAPAAYLLDFIASYEAPKGYGTVYGNKQDRLPKPLTAMTLAEVIAAGPAWSRAFGSSACGRYQFMTATLIDLRKSLVLMGSDLFSPDFQDRLALALLRRRGYEAFVAGKLSLAGFGLKIAQEWASFPVLASVKGAHRAVSRGQSYYAGDGLNKALVSPAAVETAFLNALRQVQAPTVAARNIEASLMPDPKKPPALPGSPAVPEPAIQPVTPPPQPVPEPPKTLWQAIKQSFSGKA